MRTTKKKYNNTLLTLRSLLCLGVISSTTLNATPVVHQKDPMAGIWGIWDLETNMNPNHGLYDGNWLRGSMISTNWKDVQATKNGGFDWSDLDSKIQQARNVGFDNVMVIVYHGNDSPNWIYNNGVPAVAKDPGTNRKYPLYTDPDYKTYLKALITDAAAHISANHTDIVKVVQCPIGKSGDPNPFNSGVEWLAPYTSNPYPSQPTWDQGWLDWDEEISLHYFNKYKDTGIKMLFKPADADFLFNDTPFKNHHDKMMMKSEYVTHGFQSTNEAPDALPQLALRTEKFLVRGEIGEPLKHLVSNGKDYDWDDSDDTPITNNSYWNDRPRQNLYWECLWLLHLGLDIYNIRNIEMFEDVQYVDEARTIFQFFNDRAGIKNAQSNSPHCQTTDKPWKSKYAFIALREGLAFEDNTYYSTSGTLGQQSGETRLLGIKNAVNAELNAIRSGDGKAKMGDVDAANADDNPLKYIKNCYKLNDVNSNIYKGNYTMFITEKFSNTNSRGYWNMGKNEGYSHSAHRRFGKYARGYKGNKQSMFFDVHDQFISSTANTSAVGYTIEIKVTYLDRDNDTFEIKYDGENGVVTVPVTMGNSNDWKTKTITTTTARFQNLVGSGCDIKIRRPTLNDHPIFHMIEVIKLDDGNSGGGGGSGGSGDIQEFTAGNLCDSDPNDTGNIEWKSNANASDGEFLVFHADGPGDFVQFEDINVPAAGNYDIYVGVQKISSAGIIQLQVNNGRNDIGDPVDCYAASSSFQEILFVTNKNFTSAGNKKFAFEVTGKNASASNYQTRVDYIKLVPAN